MIPRQPPLDGPAILFGDQGAPGHDEPDTEASFRLAVRLGATGLAGDLRVTSDGEPVVRGDVRLPGLRRRRIAATTSADLTDDVVRLDTLFDIAGDGLHVLLRVRDPDAVDAAIAVATRRAALDRLWLVGSGDELQQWRERSPLVRLVDGSPVQHLRAGGVERHAATLRELDVDAKLLSRHEWNGGRTALFHRFGRRCFASDAPHERMAVTLLHIGVDGVCSTHPDRLVDAARRVAAPDAPEFLDE